MVGLSGNLRESSFPAAFFLPPTPSFAGLRQLDAFRLLFEPDLSASLPSSLGPQTLDLKSSTSSLAHQTPK